MTGGAACAKLVKMRARRFILVWLLGLFIFGSELAIISGLDPGLSLKIAAGFLSLFLFPGICLLEIFCKKDEADFLDRLAFAFLASLALFSLPGLACFCMELQLGTVFEIFFRLGIFIWVVALLKIAADKSSASPPGESNGSARWLVLSLVLLSGVLAFFVGASRGPETDWDLYNYIGMVRKFVVWDQASIHHYFYAEAPPDPIHSYNLHALVWAMVAARNRIDPVQLYIHSAFLTVPLCFLGFFSLARRALGARAGFFAFSFYFFFQLIYGGLYFVGNSTFYPDDSMWLLCFPPLLSLAFLCLEKPGPRLVLLAGLSALAVSIVHVLWGLAFYLVLCFLLAAEMKGGFAALKALWQEQKQKKIKAIIFWVMMVLAYLPYVLSLVYMAAKLREEPKQWFRPLLPHFAGDRLWIYGLIFIAVPFALRLWLSPWRELKENFLAGDFYQRGYFRRALLLFLASLLLALPYAFLRWQAIQSTQWQNFGINPYRGFITPVLFLLNPFKRSFTDPNMVFHPLFWLGLVLSFWLFRLGRKESRVGALACFWAMIGVLLLVLHPVLATVFARIFTLGYLRRILRLAALLSFLPLGAFWESLCSRLKLKPVSAYAACIILSAGIAAAMIPVPAEPLYQGLFRRMVNLARPINRDSLLSDDAPFRFLTAHKLVSPNDVIYSDLYTSFRASAYLGCYVAVQAKPGVGVPDQMERRLMELEFFAPDTSLERMEEILLNYRVSWVLINRNPQYHFYGRQLGHPETVGKLMTRPLRFRKISDEGDWVIFRFQRQLCPLSGELKNRPSQ